MRMSAGYHISPSPLRTSIHWPLPHHFQPIPFFLSYPILPQSNTVTLLVISMSLHLFPRSISLTNFSTPRLLVYKLSRPPRFLFALWDASHLFLPSSVSLLPLSWYWYWSLPLSLSLFLSLCHCSLSWSLSSYLSFCHCSLSLCHCSLSP